MEAETMSPRILNELNDNGSFSTPEQDVRVVESFTKGNGYAPPAKKPNPPKPMEKSKVKLESVNYDSTEQGNYIFLQGNPHSSIAKHMSKTNKHPMQKPTTRTTKTAVATSNTNRKGTQGVVIKPSITLLPPDNKHIPVSNHSSKSRVVSPSDNAVSSGGPPKVASSYPIPSTPSRTMKKVAKPSPPETKPPEKGRYYDPVQVKSFMEQQREVRRMKERKEQEERRQEAEKKKRQLLELENKRKDLISKTSRISPKHDSKDDHGPSLATKIYRARKAKSPGPPVPIPPRIVISTAPTPSHIPGPSHLRLQTNKTSSRTVLDVKKKMSPTDVPSVRADSDAKLRTNLLLQEFESVLHKECLKLTNGGSSSQSKISLQERSRSSSHELPSPSKSSPASVHQSEKRFRIPDMSKESTESLGEKREKAAVVIQSAFRGYKIRKIWHEVTEQSFKRNPRRISFYRSRSLQTADTVRRRLPLLSPAHSPCRTSVTSLRNGRPMESKSRTAFGVSLEVPYIPPPRGSGTLDFGQRPASPRPSSQNDGQQPIAASSRLSLGGTRRSNRFDEPFPKEALKQLAQSPLPGTSPTISDSFLRREFASPHTQVNMAFIPGISELLNPAVPTFSMVLQEKVRLLQEMHQTSAKKSGICDDLTPVKRSTRPSRSMPPPLASFNYDSDSTRHASIVVSGAKSSTTSSIDATITDDYIGPGAEAMQIAYNLRKSPRKSTDTNSQGLESDSTDFDNNSTIPSSFTFTTETEEQSYVTTRKRRGDDFEKLQDQRAQQLRDQNAAERQRGEGQVKKTGGQVEKDSAQRLTTGTTDKKKQFLQLAAESLEEVRRNEEMEVIHFRAANAAAAANAVAAANAANAAAIQREASIGKKVAELQNQVRTMDVNVCSSLAKLIPPPSQIQDQQIPDHKQKEDAAKTLEIANLNLLEFAKCQTESLKATAEIQQWLADLRSSSNDDLRQNRQQETVNIAAAVFAAVEEARKISTATKSTDVRVHETKGVQTTDSLRQGYNDSKSQPNYSVDEFMESSTEDSQVNGNIINGNDKDRTDDALGLKRNVDSRSSLVQRFLQTLKSEQNELKRSTSGPDLNSTGDSLSSVQSSESLPEISSHHTTSEVRPERPVITFADVLREVKLLAMLNTTEGKTENKEELVTPKAFVEVQTVSEKSETKQPTTFENDFEPSGSETTEAPQTEFPTEFEEPVSSSSELSEKSRISELAEKLDKSAEHEANLEKSEPEKSELLVSNKPEVSAAESEVSEKPDNGASLVPESVDKSLIDVETSDFQKIESVEDSILTQILSETLQDKPVSLEEIEEESAENPTSQAAPSEMTQSLIEEIKSLHEETKEDEFEEPVSSSSEFSEAPKTITEVAENSEKSVQEATGQEDSKSEVAESQALDKPDISEHEPDSETSEKSYSEEFFQEEEETSEKSATESQDIQKSEADSFLSPILSEKPEDVSIISEKSEKLEDGSAVSQKSEKMDESAVSEKSEDEISAPVITEPPEPPILDQKSSVIIEEIESPLEETKEVTEEVTLPSDADRSFSPPPPLDFALPDEMVADMMELAQYREERGFPVRKPWRKWCVRERDIVDHVLVGEMLEDNRTWINLSDDINHVTENLVNRVARRVVRETLKAISIAKS